MKKRIEAMLDNLKDIRKDGVLSDDYELVDTCNTKIAVLTELLSNAEGEVKEYPVTLDGMCPKCKAELQINGILQIPSQPQKGDPK